MSSPAGLLSAARLGCARAPDSRRKADRPCHHFAGAFLPEDYREGNAANPLYLGATGNLPGWLALFYELGVDGLFTDNADTGVAVREAVFEGDVDSDD